VKKISLIIASVLLCMICMTGCAPKSPDKIGIVHAVGIDPSKDGFTVSFQIFRVSSSGSQTPIDPGKTNVEVVTSTAKTIANAIEKCETQLGKTLFFGHNQLIVINKDIEDIFNCLDFFADNTDSSINMVVAATEDKAKNIINSDISSGTVAAETMKKIFETSEKNGYAVASQFMKVVSAYIDTNGTAVVPVVEKRTQAISDKSKESGEPAQDAIEVNKAILITNGKFSETLEREDVLGINYFLGSIKNSDMVIDTSEGKMSVKVKSVKEKTKIDTHETDKIDFKKDITVRITLPHEESREKKNEIKTKVEQEIKKYINGVIETTLVKNRADVLNFIRLVRQSDYKIYDKNTDDLEAILERIDSEISVNAVF